MTFGGVGGANTCNGTVSDANTALPCTRFSVSISANQRPLRLIGKADADGAAERQAHVGTGAALVEINRVGKVDPRRWREAGHQDSQAQQVASETVFGRLRGPIGARRCAMTERSGSGFGANDCPTARPADHPTDHTCSRSRSSD